jgi:hypothetical protein
MELRKLSKIKSLSNLKTISLCNTLFTFKNKVKTHYSMFMIQWKKNSNLICPKGMQTMLELLIVL